MSSYFIEDKYKINPEKWTNHINEHFIEDKYKINPEKWVNKKNSNKNSSRKYSFATVFFVIGLILVSMIKNETRKLQKEIHELESSINMLKVTLHEARLDHEVITSPENLDKMAKQYLETEFTFYKRSQIKKVGEKEKIKEKKNKKLAYKLKIEVEKKIEQKKREIKKLKELSSNPKKIPGEVKMHVAKKIEQKKHELRKLYSEPQDSIDLSKFQKWGAIQVVKAFLGIPVIPGR